MKKYQLGEMEQKFADMIWKLEPVTSRELTELCGREFNWKRTTTYTMLRRLCDREIFKNRNGMVISLMSRDDFFSLQGERFLEESFEGSLPRFIAAFTSRKKLSEREVQEIQRLIDGHRED